MLDVNDSDKIFFEKYKPFLNVFQKIMEVGVPTGSAILGDPPKKFHLKYWQIWLVLRRIYVSVDTVAGVNSNNKGCFNFRDPQSRGHSLLVS